MDNLQAQDRNFALNIRVGLTIYPSQDKAIEQALVQLKDRCPAQFILLADSSGQLISIQGERGSLDVVALSALVAGDVAASHEIAIMTNQLDNYQLVLREGKKSSSFTCEAGKYLVLFVQIPGDTPLGWARILIKETAEKIAEIVDRPPDPEDLLSQGLDGIKFDDSVDNAMDSLWMG